MTGCGYCMDCGYGGGSSASCLHVQPTEVMMMDSDTSTAAELAALEPYTPTAEQSADIKMILKTDPITPDIERMAEVHSTEAEEAVSEVLAGFAEAAPGSWAAREAQR